MIDNIEFPIVDHCNLKCSLCDHFAPDSKPWFVNTDEIESNMEAVSREVTPKYIKIIGGEPLLHPEINGIIQYASCCFDVVAISTNGTLLHKMDKDFWDSGISILRITTYPGIFIPGEEFIMEMCRKNNITIQLLHGNEFNIPISEKELNGSISFNNCEIRRHLKCYTVKNGMFYPCSMAEPIERILGAGKFSISIYADYFPRLFNDNGDFIGMVPMPACSFCYGGLGDKVENKQRRSDV